MNITNATTGSSEFIFAVVQDSARVLNIKKQGKLKGGGLISGGAYIHAYIHVILFGVLYNK